MIKRIKANPFFSIVFGFVFGTLGSVALAQTVDNLNRVWNGVHTFNAPVTFSDTVTGLTIQELTMTNLTATGTLAVTGASTLTGAVAAADTLAVTGVSTFTGTVNMDGAATIDGDVTLGNNEDDTITVNGPAVFNVRRTDFDFVGIIVEPAAGDNYTPDVADNSENFFHFPGSQIPVLYVKYEQAFGGTFAEEIFLTGGTVAEAEGNVLLIDSASLLDVTDGDGIEFSLFGDPDNVALWDETSGKDAYCEISIRIDDISDISADDFYFGWFINAAFTAAFNHDGAASFAAFSVADTAGDLVLDSSGGVDDSGITIADNGTYVLRVEMSADAVSYFIDGAAITVSNAVLNAGNDSTYNCLFGIRSAGTSAAIIELEYIEVGLEQ